MPRHHHYYFVPITNPCTMFIDTHAHLYLKQFKSDRDAVLARAGDAGITTVYLPNIDSTSINDMLALEALYPARCFAMMGLHPCSVKENYREELQTVRHWLDKRPFCAVGEIGIDLHWDTTFIEEQKKAFITQVGWAKELDLPIVIHARKSLDILIELVSKEKDDRLRGIFHCFTGDIRQAQKIMDLGFYMGIGGVLTYKNAGLDQAVKNIPLEWLVLETDAPYLSPVPFRGKRNESAYIEHIAAKLSMVKGVDIKVVASTTTANAKKIFGKNSSSYTTVY